MIHKVNGCLLQLRVILTAHSMVSLKPVLGHILQTPQRHLNCWTAQHPNAGTLTYRTWADLNLTAPICAWWTGLVLPPKLQAGCRPIVRICGARGNRNVFYIFVQWLSRASERDNGIIQKYIFQSGQIKDVLESSILLEHTHPDFPFHMWSKTRKWNARVWLFNLANTNRAVLCRLADEILASSTTKQSGAAGKKKEENLL